MKKTIVMGLVIGAVAIAAMIAASVIPPTTVDATVEHPEPRCNSPGHSTGDPHEGSKGNPHEQGEKGNPHDRCDGNGDEDPPEDVGSGPE